ncbi:MAG: polysaccharide biosynthesis tyrosine autokinase [Mucilaginibacter sp.]|jgi:capsular exopolysaccharide synthesis family protein|uniref:GumC family protein n=1 Tax=Mucilaginibacter sp. TaxID=1882438 RepID=UPI003564B22F
MKKDYIIHPTVNNADYKDVARPYLKKWYWFVVSVVICLLLSWSYLHFTAPLYKVTATLLIPDDKQGGGLMKATAFSDLNMFHEVKTVDNEMEILRSRDLMYRVLSKLDIGTEYYAESLLKNNELYGKELPIKVTVLTKKSSAVIKKYHIIITGKNSLYINDGIVQKTARFNQAISLPGISLSIAKGPAFVNYQKPLLVMFKDISQLAESYSAGKLKITPVIKESNTLILSVLDAVPQRGIDILNTVINIYNNIALEKKNRVALQTINFLDKRLGAMETDLSSTEIGIENYKQQNNASDVSAGSQINLSKSAEYNRLLEESDVQLGVVNQMLDYLRSSKHEFNIVPSTTGLKDAVLMTLVSKFNDLQMDRDRLLRNANATNPLVQNVTGQISALRNNIIENLVNIKQSIRIENNHLKANSANYSSKIHSAPTMERVLLQRGREQVVKTNLYQYFLQKREETALSLMTVVPVSEVVDRPAYSSMPSSPKSELIYLGSTLLGLLIPFGVVYTTKKFALKVNNSTELNEMQGLRILGELCHNECKDNVVVTKNSRSNISELFRYIRTNLSMLKVGDCDKVILVTSCGKGEGKTFFCINMGLTLAMLNKKVIVLEFDLRKPDLLRKMNMQQRPGISDYLNGDVEDFSAGIQRYRNSSHLYTLGCGTIPESPAELLNSPRVKVLFEKLRNMFDYVIIDTSPVGAVADAFNLSPFADMSVYLVRYNYTSNKQLNILKDIYDHQKLNNLMVVFNDAKPENRPVYAYGAYGYNSEKAEAI